MAEREFKTEHRITNIMNELNMSDDHAREVYYAFDKLLILTKRMPDSFRAMNKVTFTFDKNNYMEKMRWMNAFMREHGMTEDVFRDVTNFETCSEDYDYYNEYKTPTQYKKDEEERMAKKAAQDASGSVC